MALSARSLMGRLCAALVAFSLVGFPLFLSSADTAYAQSRSSGGRIGGGSFRSPAPAPAPRSYGGGGYGGGGYGGGYYAPPPVVPVPIPAPYPYGGGYVGGGFGFGGILTLVLVAGAGLLLFRLVRRVGSAAGAADGTAAGEVTLARLQVALLAAARELQRDLARIAESADTSTPEGLVRVNQEVTLALLRHPEYWVYAASGQENLALEAAESRFGQLALAERSKYTDETINRGERTGLVRRQFGAPNPEETAEYIVVTVLAGAEGGTINLAPVRSAEQLRQALALLGSLGPGQLLALEVIWSPADENDSLTSEELLTQYSDLVRL